MKKTSIALAFAALVPASALSQEIGIKECDSFVEHYQKCVASGAPAAARKAMEAAAADLRRQYLDLKASVPASTLVEICKDGREGMKQTLVEVLKCAP